MRGAIRWFAENHVAANLLMVLLAVGGVASLPIIQQKTFPDIDVNIIQIGVAYLGAAPEEVEEGVCIRIEEEIQGITGIERITSSAAEGACGVSVELLDDYPVDRALSEVKNAVDAITTFPVETEKPIVNYISIKRDALVIALSAEASERALKVYGERMRDEIAALPGVTQVDLYNSRVYEISVEVPEESLRRYGLTFDQVVSAVRRSSLDRPGGSIKTAGGEILLRAKGQAYTGEDFERIVVHTRDDGTRLLLGEVANVVDGFEEDAQYAVFDDRPAVTIKVFRVGDQKVLELVDLVRSYLTTGVDLLPASFDLTVWQNGAQVLRDRLDILIRNGRSGFFLVFVVLALFLRLRLAIWVSLGVPLSILGALWLFPVLDISIDVISLFAFITVLGLLVDDAIVVGENVHRHQERAEEPLEAAIRGTQEVSVPVIFGVLTTVAAFTPMLMAPGFMGQIFGTIGLVVICCLLFSVIESQLVLPAHLGHMRVGGEEKTPRPGSLAERWTHFQTQVSGSLVRVAREVYRPRLERVLEWRYTALAVGVSTLILAAGVLSTGVLKFAFFPPIESDYIHARLTMPQGTPVEITAAGVEALRESARAMKAELDGEFLVDGESLVQHVMLSVGDQPSTGSGPPNARGVTSSSNIGEVSLELASGDVRPISAKEVADRWRKASPAIPGAEELVFVSALFSVGDPIDLQLQSANVDDLQVAAERVKAKLAKYPGVFDISDSFRGGKRELKLSILPAAESLGLTLDDLARQVRQAFYGEEAQRIQRGRDDIRVMVRYPENQRRSLGDLDNLRVRTPAGGEVPFYAVARAEESRGFATIKRSNRQRVIDVTADVDRTKIEANAVLADLNKQFMPQLLADFPGMSFSLEGEQQEQAESLAALGSSYIFALVAIYALLAIPLRSYLQPLIIMAVIPFGLVGALIGHLVMLMFKEGFNVSMMSVFGVVALTGVVVNSSLVLVHYVNQRRAQGSTIEQAVRDAGVARFRPIVLTSLTTFAGLLPLLTEGSVSAQFLIPMATSLAFGVLFATGISLFLVPCSYLILEDLTQVAREAFGAAPGGESGLPPGRGEPPVRSVAMAKRSSDDAGTR